MQAAHGAASLPADDAAETDAFTTPPSVSLRELQPTMRSVLNTNLKRRRCGRQHPRRPIHRLRNYASPSCSLDPTVKPAVWAPASPNRQLCWCQLSWSIAGHNSCRRNAHRCNKATPDSRTACGLFSPSLSARIATAGAFSGLMSAFGDATGRLPQRPSWRYL